LEQADPFQKYELPFSQLVLACVSYKLDYEGRNISLIQLVNESSPGN